MRPLRQWVGRASVGWGAVDQALSSGTNFALLFLTVRAVNVREYGTFSLVYLVYILVLPIARSTGTMPYTVRYARTPREQAAGPTTASIRFAFAFGLVMTAVCLVLAAVSVPIARGSFLVLGLCFPLLLVQDAVRGVFFVRSEYVRATINDGVWAAVMFLVLVPLVVMDVHAPVVVYVAAWCAGGAVAGLVGIGQLRIRLAIVTPLTWLRQNADLARPLFMTTLFTILPAQLTYLLMPAVSSLGELGAVRAVYVLFGVLGVIYTTVAMIALPHASRLAPTGARRFAVLLSGAMAVIAVCWGLVILALPAAIGRDIIGPVWDRTATVRLLLAISLVAEGITLGPTTVLAALHMPERMARVRYVTAPLTLALGLFLAAGWGAAGVSLGFAIGYSATAVMSWLRVPSRTELESMPVYRPPITSESAEGP